MDFLCELICEIGDDVTEEIREIIDGVLPRSEKKHAIVNALREIFEKHGLAVDEFDDKTVLKLGITLLDELL